MFPQPYRRSGLTYFCWNTEGENVNVVKIASRGLSPLRAVTKSSGLYPTKFEEVCI